MMSKLKTLWTPQEDATLKEMYIAGNTYTEIAVAINKSRGAVAGKITRLPELLKRETLGSKIEAKPKPKSPRPRATYSVAKMPAPKSKPLPAAPIVPLTSFPNAVNFYDLEDHHCRWQIRDDPPMYCGEQSLKVYCPFHMAVAKRAPSARVSSLAATYRWGKIGH